MICWYVYTYNTIDCHCLVHFLLPIYMYFMMVQVMRSESSILILILISVLLECGYYFIFKGQVHVCLRKRGVPPCYTIQWATSLDVNYRSVPGKRPWALKHNSRFWPSRALTWDITSIRLYRSCYIDPLKLGTWVLTREWALAWDTTVSTCAYTWCDQEILL